MPRLTLPDPPAIALAPLRHFSGELVSKSADAKLDLHRLSLRLVDDEGVSHQVLIAHGRGDQAAERCAQQYDALQVGARYHGSATQHAEGPEHHWWLGVVTLQPCRRRPLYELTARGVAA